jgi:hypothetical protein
MSCWVIEQLKESIASQARDVPDDVSAQVPSRVRVLEALHCFQDVLFPGRMMTELDDDQGIEAFIQERMSRGHRLLAREIARALPFRWRGAYAASTGEAQPIEDVEQVAAAMANTFLSRLPEVRTPTPR